MILFSGTWIDGKRLSSAKKESKPQEIGHGTLVKIGSTQLICHVHPGHETCTKCEPGLVIASKPKYNISSQIDSKDRDEKRKSKLKEIREKYGITSSQELEVGSTYKDRADERRKTKGSDHGNFFNLFVF